MSAERGRAAARTSEAGSSSTQAVTGSPGEDASVAIFRSRAGWTFSGCVRLDDGRRKARAFSTTTTTTTTAAAAGGGAVAPAASPYRSLAARVFHT